MGLQIKKTALLKSGIYLIASIVTFIILISLITMLIGNYATIGNRIKKVDDTINEFVQHNILSEEAQEELQDKKKIYLYGHPWLMLILVTMTTITAINYIIKGTVYLMSQHYDDSLESKIRTCLQGK